MLSALLVVLATAPLSPVKLALPGLNAVNLAPGEIDLQAELVAQKFLAHGVEVMTSRDLQAVLGLERQKLLLGCAENNACIVEMTAALGVDGVIIGDLGKLDGQYVLNLKVLASSSGRVLALHNARAAPAGLERMMENSVRAVLRGLATALGRPDLDRGAEPLPELAPAPAGPSVRTLSLVPGAVGVAALATGAVLQVLAGQKYDALTAGHLEQGPALALKTQGQSLELGANVALIGGGVAVAAAVVMFFAGAPVTPTVAVGPGGAAIGLSGVLP